MTTSIVVNSIEKETEKAIMVSVQVCWNEGATKAKNIWFPKKHVDMSVFSDTNKVVCIPDWLERRICAENAWNGYHMEFAFCAHE